MLGALCLAVAMFTISDRDNFWDPEKISKETQYAQVDEQGITKLLSKKQTEEFWSDLKNKRVLVLIHGFNSPTPYSNYHNIRVNVENLELASAYDFVIGYVWPSYDDSVEYRIAKTQLQKVKPILAKTLSHLSSSVASVDVIAHSMGNRLLLETLNSMQEGAKQVVRNFFAWAPAVDNESIDMNQVYYPATQLCQNLYVFFSQRDGVLKWDYPIPELDMALGLAGDENSSQLPKNTQLVDCTDVIDEHSAYILSKPIYDYLQKIQEDELFTPVRSKNVKISEEGSSVVVGLYRS
jgi:esterase/lipase superfamily enzyme